MCTVHAQARGIATERISRHNCIKYTVLIIKKSIAVISQTLGLALKHAVKVVFFTRGFGGYVLCVVPANLCWSASGELQLTYCDRSIHFDPE